MSKTAISTLQEYMAKRVIGMPEYVLVQQTTGTHVTSFTYKVICGQHTAHGTAPCKKEAKHCAAREMLKVLAASNDNDRQSLIGRPGSKTLSADSYYISSGSANISYDNVFVNSVGKLSEYCISRRYKTPQYTDENSFGADHSKTFVIKCSVGSLSAEGSASTKKQAKHEAAQHMYQLLVKTASPTDNPDLCEPPKSKDKIDGPFEAKETLLNVRILDLKMEEPTMPVEKSCEKALELFPKLRHQNSVKITKNFEVKDYHDALRNCVIAWKRETVRKRLADSSVAGDKTVLKEILDLLNVGIEYQTLKSRNDECIVRCTLDSTPVITDVGIGKSVQEATDRARANLFKTLDVLLR